MAFAIAIAPSAHAGDAAGAEALFRDAKKQMAAGNYEQACPKLAESQRLDPAVGTQLALALCYEKQGKLASAWATYREAISSARQARQPDREKIAQDRALMLETKLAQLAIKVPANVASLKGFTVKRDDVEVSQASFGTATPVDAGDHVVTASADGKKPVTLHAKVADGERQEVAVPPLEDDPAAAAPPPVAKEPERKEAFVPPPQTEEASTGSGKRTFGWVLVTTGVVGLGVGTFFGIRAVGMSGDAKDLCGATACPDHDAAMKKHDDAVTNANVANVAIGVGAVALIVGGVLVVTSGGSSSKVSAGATPLPGGGAFALRGRW